LPELPSTFLVADPERRGLARILLVLRNLADGGELVDAVVRAHARMTGDDSVRPDPAASTHADVGADHGVGSYITLLADNRPRMHDGSRMDHVIGWAVAA